MIPSRAPCCMAIYTVLDNLFHENCDAQMPSNGKLRKGPGAQILRTLPRLPDLIARIDWSPNGRFISSASRTGFVSVWDAETGGLIMQRRINSYHAYNARWSPDGKLLAVSGDKANILTLNPFTGDEINCVNLPIPTPKKSDMDSRPSVMGLDWSPDGRWLAAGCFDCLRILDSVSGEIRHSFSEQRRITGVAWSPDGGGHSVYLI